MQAHSVFEIEITYWLIIYLYAIAQCQIDMIDMSSWNCIHVVNMAVTAQFKA